MLSLLSYPITSYLSFIQVTVAAVLEPPPATTDQSDTYILQVTFGFLISRKLLCVKLLNELQVLLPEEKTIAQKTSSMFYGSCFFDGFVLCLFVSAGQNG